jgi:hypothetical protein
MTSTTNATHPPSPRLIFMAALGVVILLGLLAGSPLTGSSDRAQAQDSTPSTPIRLRISDIVQTQQAAQTTPQTGVTIEEAAPNPSILDIRSTATAAAANATVSTSPATFQTGIIQAITVGVTLVVAGAIGWWVRLATR